MQTDNLFFTDSGEPCDLGESSIAGIEAVAVPRSMTQPAFPKTGVAGDGERPVSHFEKTAQPN